MPLEQRIGQLFMVGTDDPTPEESLQALVADNHIGSVLYLGAGPWTAALTREASATIAAWGGDVPVLLAADQEGGQIQRLDGSGFSDMPSAAQQGRMTPAALEAKWRGWGKELRDAGVLFDLAPVADVVPPGIDAQNAPVGALDSNFGTTRETVAASASAAVRGLTGARVASSLKHYPGLGRTDTNTDFGVAHDDATEATDVADYQAPMDAGASSVMISSSIYSEIDPGVPAVFSKKIINGLLREGQGWTKVVISDDLGAAQAVADVPVRERGLRFLQAGGDLVINADPAKITEMVDGVGDHAVADEAFAAEIDQHAARVLALKASVGLLQCSA